MQLFWGFVSAVVVAGLAWKAGALNRNGAIAAVVTGSLIFGLGGLPWAALLLTFFISSSLLSRLFARQKVGLAEKYSKGSHRDWAQVMANGGLGALLALAWGLGEQPTWAWVAFAGAMAAVNADTWATELGVLNPAPPKLITNLRSVEPGTSGAISLLGSLSTLAGAFLIAALSAAFTDRWSEGIQGSFQILVSVTLGGVCGAFFDSWLGATIQAVYYCPACNKETERHPLHICGTVTTHRRGWRWLNNDLVNLLCSFVGALVTVGLWFCIT